MPEWMWYVVIGVGVWWLWSNGYFKRFAATLPVAESIEAKKRRLAVELDEIAEEEREAERREAKFKAFKDAAK